MQESLCNICNRGKVVYFRAYSGERLCSRCFTKTFEKRVAKTIAKYNMLRYNDRIAVAVSGGKDSLTLLKVLAKIETKFPESSMVAITVDEGINVYRDEAIKNAEDFISKMGGIEHVKISFKELYGVTLEDIVKDGVVDKAGIKPCTVCGILRRRALDIAARRVGASVIATAHTLDDVVQTYLMNVFRGDIDKQPFGTRTEVEGFIPRVAPFKLTPEHEVVMYAYLHNIPFQSHVCPYARTSMRDMIRNFLIDYEENYPGTLYTALTSFERLIRPSDVLLQKCEVCGVLTSRRVCRTCEVLKQLGLKEVPVQ
ncbi:MAG: TIGR00269 family protein [Nitrososphaerota archaeon]|nr:TIGR00269 family protein [Aigarchaeota archaeon]MDW8076851.1 TIGR00269 family protein [Nitrososphaerota archaeon]